MLAVTAQQGTLGQKRKHINVTRRHLWRYLLHGRHAHCCNTPKDFSRTPNVKKKKRRKKKTRTGNHLRDRPRCVRERFNEQAVRQAFANPCRVVVTASARVGNVLGLGGTRAFPPTLQVFLTTGNSMKQRTRSHLDCNAGQSNATNPQASPLNVKIGRDMFGRQRVSNTPQ